jgi:membrane protease YdiL (CAAX protease family)
MTTTTSRATAPISRYHRLTRTATYGFLAALPLLFFYELLIHVVNRGQAAQVRVGADIWMKQVLAWLGGTGSLALSAAVVLVGVGVLLYERRKKIPIRPGYFGWIVAESAIYAVFLAFLVSFTVGMLFAVAAMPPAAAASSFDQLGFWTRLALSIGAGLYEELVFRVILVGGLFLGLRRLMAHPGQAYVVAALIGAILFSAVHYIGAFGDSFTLPSFTFRFLFGLALNAVFLWRGFAVAAWTHALYDVMLVTRIIG